MNWGYKMMFSYLAFVGMMLVFVYRTTLVRSDLVSENYYSEELKYQNQIEKVENTKSKQNEFSYTFSADKLLITFNDLNANGKLLLFKPDNAAFDKVYLIVKGELVIQTRSLPKGKWILKADWISGSKPFYNEQVFFKE